jgi:outer membrane autotransporter protein
MVRVLSAAYRWSTVAVVLVAMLVGLSAPAVAQVIVAPPPPVDPTESTFSVERPYLTQQLQGQSSNNISSAVSGHVGDLLIGLGSGPPPAPPPAYAAEARDSRAKDNPLAAFAAVTATPKWSVWTDFNAVWSERTDPIAGNKGRLYAGNVAIDRRVGDRGVIGILGSFEHADFDTTFSNGTLKHRAAGGGVYAGYAVTDVWVVDGLARWQKLNADVTGGGSASYDTLRMQLAANITGYLTYGVFSVRPTAGISYTQDDQDSYTDTTGLFAPSQRVTTTTGSAGLQVGRVFALDGARSVEPWVGATALWESFSSNPPPTISGSGLDPFDVTVSAGLTAKLSDRIQFTVKSQFGGLARANYDTFLAGGYLSVQF